MPRPNSPHQRRRTTAADVFTIVRSCIAVTVDVPPTVIEPTTPLFGELAATSSDITELLHRLDVETGAVGEATDLASLLRGAFCPFQFADPSGRLTERGRAQLTMLLPHRRNTARQLQTIDDAVDSLTVWALAILVARGVASQDGGNR